MKPTTTAFQTSALTSEIATLQLQPQVQPKRGALNALLFPLDAFALSAFIRDHPSDWWKYGEHEDNGHYNPRNAMRVLEDYLCAAVLGLDQSPPVYAPSRSLRKLIESGEHKEALSKVMAEHGLTKFHLQLMREIKKKGNVYPSRVWDRLVQATFKYSDNIDTRNAKIHLFKVLTTFTKGNTSLDALKSPFFEDDFVPHRVGPVKFRVW